MTQLVGVTSNTYVQSPAGQSCRRASATRTASYTYTSASLYTHGDIHTRQRFHSERQHIPLLLTLHNHEDDAIFSNTCCYVLC